ncbi:rCG55140, partial [Rattus norvegicus]
WPESLDSLTSFSKF